MIQREPPNKSLVASPPSGRYAAVLGQEEVWPLRGRLRLRRVLSQGCASRRAIAAHDGVRPRSSMID